MPRAVGVADAKMLLQLPCSNLWRSEVLGPQSGHATPLSNPGTGFVEAEATVPWKGGGTVH